MTSKVIAISGGIGAGKSVVSRLVSVMGFPVYDCDSQARRLMDASTEIQRRLAIEISPLVVEDDGINRAALSEIVFADEKKLTLLNEIVHSAVREDLMTWIANSSSNLKFVETAILYQSGLDKMVDEVWMVIAPDPLRISRVMCRNSMTRQQVQSRINSQDSFVPISIHSNVKEIVNDDVMPLIPQVLSLLTE